MEKLKDIERLWIADLPLLDYMRDMKKDIDNFVNANFRHIRLSGNFLHGSVVDKDNKLLIRPKHYDTAWYIKTSRQARRGGEGVMRFRSGSYADELNKYGSEIEVFKKKPNLPPHLKRKTIAKLGETNLIRVKIHIGNHKNFISNAIVYATTQFMNKHKGEIKEVSIWLEN